MITGVMQSTSAAHLCVTSCCQCAARLQMLLEDAQTMLVCVGTYCACMRQGLIWIADAESSGSDYHHEAASQYMSIGGEPMTEGADSLRSSLDGAVQLSTDGGDPQMPADPLPSISRRSSLRMSTDGTVLTATSQHGSMRSSLDGGLPAVQSWRNMVPNLHDGNVHSGLSARSSFRNSATGSPAVQHEAGADAGVLMHRLSNLSTVVTSDAVDLEEHEDEPLSASPSSSGSEGYRDKDSGSSHSDDRHDDLVSPNQFSDFSFKNYGLLAQHNMEALRAELGEAHADKSSSVSSAENDKQGPINQTG